MIWQLKYHKKSCGVQWACKSCEKIYKERTSLLVHCKRSGHELPTNAKIRNQNQNQTPVNNILLMPIIIHPAFRPTERLILPKLNSTTESSIQTDKSQCSCLSQSNQRVTNVRMKFISSSTQTERINFKSTKQSESRSAQCPPVISNRNKRSLKRCAQTQTLESTLHETLPHEKRTKISASTSTSPPKKGKRHLNQTNYNSKRQCVETQTDIICDYQTVNDGQHKGHVLTMPVNPLLSQQSNLFISEQSVQTESFNELEFGINNIETQTSNIDIESTNLLHFDPNDLFSELEFTDIETQTNWNSDGTTQTDFEIDDEIIKQFFSSECQVPNETIFADTQTQTQFDITNFICSYQQNTYKN